MKWLVALVLVAAANARLLMAPKTPAEMVCTPGSTFKIECNTCFCTQSGMNYGCTRMACEQWNDYDTLNYDDNNLLPVETNENRPVKYENFRKKRAAGDVYADDQQQFVMDDEPAPRSLEQQKEIARQNYLQQQQDYYDQLRLQQDLAREKEELDQQQEEMQTQLQYQQEQDAEQWEEDARQQAFERQQQFIEHQRLLLEQQQQQKQNDQYFKKVRNYGRKTIPKPQ